MKSFLGIIAHFIDDNWEYKSLLFDICIEIYIFLNIDINVIYAYTRPYWVWGIRPKKNDNFVKFLHKYFQLRKSKNIQKWGRGVYV